MKVSVSSVRTGVALYAPVIVRRHLDWMAWSLTATPFGLVRDEGEGECQNAAMIPHTNHSDQSI